VQGQTALHPNFSPWMRPRRPRKPLIRHRILVILRKVWQPYRSRPDTQPRHVPHNEVNRSVTVASGPRAAQLFLLLDSAFPVRIPRAGQKRNGKHQNARKTQKSAPELARFLVADRLQIRRLQRL
jgi:hypothetical protein